MTSPTIPANVMEENPSLGHQIFFLMAKGWDLPKIF